LDRPSRVGKVDLLAAASELLKPFAARLMRCYPVSNRINRVANDDEESSRPVELAEIENRLFL
jgi:putative SOS response-associated peptidase YedK